MIIKLFLFFSFLILTVSGGSQATAFYNSQSFGPDEGLQVDGAINYLSCDNKGYIWICTTNGLFRFNGTLFKKFTAKKTTQNSLPAKNVRFFIQDKIGRYILNADGTGLSSYNDSTGEFRPIKLNHDTIGLHHSILQAPFFDDRNNLWIAVERKGILCLNFSNNNYRFYDTKDPVTGNNGFVSTAWINFITQLRNGEILAGTNAGIIKLDPESGKITRYFHPLKNLKHANGSIYEDEDGSWWMATWAQGLLHYFPDSGKWEQYFIKPEFINGTQNILSSIIYKNQNELWISSHYGLYVFNKKGRKFHPLTDIKNKITQLTDIDKGSLPEIIPGWVSIKDNNGNLWSYDDKKIYRIQLTGNLFPYTLVPFGKVDNPGAFSFKEIFPDTASEDQYFLTSYFGHGFYIYDKVTGNSRLVSNGNTPVPSGSVNYSVLKNNQLWLCTESGLFLYDVMQKKFVSTSRPNLDSVTKKKNVTSIAFTDSFIWVSAGSLYRYNNFTGEINAFTGDEKNKLSGADILQLFADRSQNLWIALGAGKNVYCLVKKTGKLINYNLRPEISSGNGSAIAQTPDETLFFSSFDNGLYKIDNPLTAGEKISLYTSDNGLPSDRIYNMYCDSDGYLWLSTSNGLCICNTKNMQFASFNLNNNFPENDFYGTPYQLSHSNFLIPLKYGYTLINRDSLLKNSIETIPLSVHKFTVNGKSFPQSVDYGGFIDLTYKQNNLSLDFSALCFEDATGINYYYYIKGLNNDTVNISNRTNISLYSLPPGNYILQIFIKKRNGPIQPPGFELNFHIHPPFWKTRWFISLLVLAIAGILYMLYRYRINQLMRLQKVRSNIAQDLHDDVGSTMTTISILSDVVKKQMRENEKPSQILEEIGDHARTLMEKLDDIVWSVNPKNDSLNQMTLRMKKQAIDLLGNKGIKVNFDLPDNLDNISLPMEKRRNIFLIYKEAVHNISKYAEAKNVNISISVSAGEMKLTIADDGAGFDATTAKQGNGIINMQKRAEQCRGACNIQSAPGKGTTVSFSIPV